MDFTSLLVTSTVLAAGLFALVWVLSVRLDNYSFVDVMWASALSVIVPLAAWMSDGAVARRWLAVVVALAWSLRLGAYLLARIMRHHPQEDARYQALREKWSAGLRLRFFLFFQSQALTIVIMAVPFLLMCVHRAPGLGWIEWTGAVVALLAVLGEALSDYQRLQHRRSGRGGVCTHGLWRWSRHPNYFFEFMVWVGVWLMACGSPWGWLSLGVPLMLLYLLLRVTGIPLTEEHELARHGEAYRAYQRRTSAFVPLPPRREV